MLFAFKGRCKICMQVRSSYYALQNRVHETRISNVSQTSRLVLVQPCIFGCCWSRLLFICRHSGDFSGIKRISIRFIILSLHVSHCVSVVLLCPLSAHSHWFSLHFFLGLIEGSDIACKISKASSFISSCICLWNISIANSRFLNLCFWCILIAFPS
jgi:hypothetical protein